MKSLKQLLLSSFIIFLFLLLTPKVQAEDLLISWNNTTSLSNEIASNVLYTYNNHITIVGGANSDIVNINSSGAILNNGEIASWIPSVVGSQSIFWHSSAQKNNIAYIIGGATYPISTIVKSVYLGTIDNSGLITSWIPTVPLPKELALASAVVMGNRLYVSGGFSNGFVTSKEIYAAVINGDGTLGTWVDVGDLPSPRAGHATFVHNNHLIVIGGRNFSLSSGYTATAYSALINPDGTIGSWTQTSSLPQASARAGVVEANGKVFWIGGEIQIGDSFLNTNKVYSATINNDGTLGVWATNPVDFPQTVCCGAAAAVGEYIYYTGGLNGSSYLDSVYYAKIETTPPPNPNPSDLSVNLLKQTSQPWEDDTYDSANLWSPSTPTINRWGCAMTSATMILNYHGLTKINETTPLDPGTLNTWLKSQNDGYIRNGLINWLAVSRLSRQIKSFNSSFTHDALEYKRVRGMDNTQLDTDISVSQPDILEVPGHFIVAKGKTSSSYSINDPFYNRITLADSYNNSYLSIGRYIPSHTDLSYFMLVVNPEVNIMVKSQTGETVGEEYIQQPIQDPVSTNSSGKPVKIFYYSQPYTGQYIIDLDSAGESLYEMDMYLYDKYGAVKKVSYSGMVNSFSGDTFSISYNNENVESTKTNNLVTFEEFSTDITFLTEQNNINRVTAILLQVALKNAQKDFNAGKKSHAIQKIDLFQKLISNFSKNDVNDVTIQLLLYNLEGLRNYILAN